MQDMQTRLLAILAALFAVAALVAGCSGSSDDSATDLPDAATLLQESSETTAGETSAHLKLAVQGQIAELPVESLEGDLTQRPAVAAKGTADIVFLGQRLQGVQFVVADGDLYAAITAGGSLSNFGPASDIYDVAAILSPEAGLANVLSNFSDAKADGRETVEGVTPSASPAWSAPTPSTRSPRRSPRPPRFPAPPGSPRTATTS